MAFDHRRQDREHPLNAFAEADLADGEILVEAGAGAGDADALVGLDALALAFLDLHVDADACRPAGSRGSCACRAGEAFASAFSIV
jgi:hypothetical protein